MTFMTGAFVTIDGARCYVTRSGYTGEDGFEISTPADAADAIARKLLAAARGEADRARRARFAAARSRALPLRPRHRRPRRRRSRPACCGASASSAATQGGFPGAAVIQQQIAEGAPRKRVGLLPEGKRDRARGRRDRRSAGKVDRQGHVAAASRPTLGRADRHGLRRRAPHAGQRHQGRACRARQAACRPRSCPCPSSRHAYYRG